MENLKSYHPGITTIGILMNCFLLSFCTIKTHKPTYLNKHYTLEINAGVKNLLDQFQTDLDKGMDRDAGFIYGPATPRTYFVGINLKI